MGFEWEVGSWLTSRVWVNGGTSNRDENIQKEELFSGKEGNVLFLAYTMEFEMSMENQGWAVQRSAGFLSLKCRGDVMF